MTDSLPYLIRLGQRLQQGLAGFDAERLERHRRFVLSFQQDDGGFSGREGDSDLYYSSFATRTLAMLDGLSPDCRDALAGYAKRHDWRNLGVIDLLNWLSIALAIQAAGGEDLLRDEPDSWPEDVAGRLENVRRSDGGYAKAPEGAAGSTYHSFLVSLTYQLIDQSQPDVNGLVQFLFDRQRDDGGFVEIAPMKRSGTNPTAAAVAILNEYDYLDAEVSADVVAFLKEVKGDEGGFRANTRIPFADGLSTFTGVLTSQDIGSEVIPAASVRDYIENWLEFPTGGFRAASWDEAADVEYTFYGLGTLALLSVDAAS